MHAVYSLHSQSPAGWTAQHTLYWTQANTHLHACEGQVSLWLTNQSYSSGRSCVFHARHWLLVRSAMLAAGLPQWLLLLLL